MPAILQPAFSGGEISPALYARTDLARYGVSLRTCRNFLVQRFGGVVSRPGLRFVNAVKDSTRATRLLPFVFQTGDTYVIELGHLYARFYRNGALIRDPGTSAIIEVVTPWSEAELPAVRYAQAGNILTLVHPNHAPRDLFRLTDHHLWTLQLTPFAPANAAPGSAPTLAGGGATNPKLHQYVVTYIGADGVESLPSPIGSTTTDLQANTPVTVTIVGFVAGTWNVYRGRGGVFGYIGTTTTSTFLDENVVPDYGDPPPTWSNPFAGPDKWPATITYFQQRRWYGGTASQPQRLWGSASAQFGNFGAASPARPDDAIDVTLASQRPQDIRALVPLNDLVILTSEGEWTTDTGDNGPLTPSNTGFRPRSYYGSSTVQPELMAESAFLVERGGRKLRDIRYDAQVAGYTGTDLTVLADHLTRAFGIVEIAAAANPHSVLWCVRADGVLLALTYLREQEVWAWSRHDTAGAVERITVVPEGADGDVLYAVVRRVIAGTTVRYVERLTSRFVTDPLAYVGVDSSLTWDGRNRSLTSVAITGALTAGSVCTATFTSGTPASAVGANPTAGDELVILGAGGVELVRCQVVSGSGASWTVIPDRTIAVGVTPTTGWAWAESRLTGLGHLAGQTVVAACDRGTVQRGLVVAGDGSVTLERPAYVAHVGLGYTCTLETLDLSIANAPPVRSQRKAIEKVVVYVQDTASLWVQAPGAREATQSKPKREGDRYDDPNRPITDTIEVRPESTWENTGRVIVEQRDPLPATILAITPEVELGR